MIKILLTPSISSLNDFLAYKFTRVLKQHQKDKPKVIVKLFSIFLNELYYSYDAFHTIADMHFTCDSLRDGPHFDNVGFSFDFL